MFVLAPLTLSVKFVSDQSAGAPLVTCTRTRQLVLAINGARMVFEPEFVTLPASLCHHAPPSTAKSMFTLPPVPVVLQVTVAGAPAVQMFPPLGEMTVTPFVGVIGKK